MNFGESIYQWFVSNLQPLMLVAIIVSGFMIWSEQKKSKIIGVVLVLVIAVFLVFDTAGAKDILVKMAQSWFK